MFLGKGNCDSGYADWPHMEIVAFVPFPKPIKSLEKCSTWIKLWGRPHEQLNVSKVSAYKYVCSLVRTKIFTYKQP